MTAVKETGMPGKKLYFKFTEGAVQLSRPCNVSIEILAEWADEGLQHGLGDG